MTPGYNTILCKHFKMQRECKKQTSCYPSEIVRLDNIANVAFLHLNDIIQDTRYSACMYIYLCMNHNKKLEKLLHLYTP